MRSLFKRFVTGAVVGLGLLATVAGVPLAYSAALTLFTGPCYPVNGTTCNPINFPPVLGDIDTIITSINSSIAQWLTLNASTAEAGELAFSSPNAFAANGNVATAMSSVGPTGSHTTIQKWLAIIDNTGAAGWIPIF